MPAWLQEAAEAVAAKRGRAALEAADDEEDAHQPKERGPPTKRQLFFCRLVWMAGGWFYQRVLQ